jgi:hypothetical protein
MNLNQIVVNMKLINLTIKNSDSAQLITSIEMNILDTANLKLVRDDHLGNDDSIKIPFNLSKKNKENFNEFYFNVSECTFAQKLKGTLTYILKDENTNDSVQEKIDFKISVPCSAFLIQSTCDR